MTNKILILIAFIIYTLASVNTHNLGQVSIYQSTKYFIENIQKGIVDLISQDKMNKVEFEDFSYFSNLNYSSFVFSDIKVISSNYKLEMTPQINATQCEYTFNSSSSSPSNELEIQLSYEFKNTLIIGTVKGIVSFKASSQYTITKKWQENEGSFLSTAILDADYKLGEFKIDDQTLISELKPALEDFIKVLTPTVENYFNQKLNNEFNNFYVFPFYSTNSINQTESLALNMNLSDEPICFDNYLVNFYKGSLTKNWNKTYAKGNFFGFNQNEFDYQIFVSHTALNELLQNVNENRVTFNLNNKDVISTSPFYLNIQSLGQIIPEIYNQYPRSDSFYVNFTLSNSTFRNLNPDRNDSAIVLEYLIESRVYAESSDEELFSFKGFYQSEVNVNELDLQLEILYSNLVKLEVNNKNFRIFYSNTLRKWISEYLDQYLLLNPINLLSHPYNLKSRCIKMDHYTVGTEGIVLTCDVNKSLEHPAKIYELKFLN